MRANNPVRIGSASLYGGDALAIYDAWDAPTCIVSDGPYGLGKFPGEANTHDGLAEWYSPHVAEWMRRSSATTTLWFWNSELGWATVHPILVANGWQYEECCIWDKGIAHVAGNCNSKTIRGVPVVTEVCVRYVRVATLETAKGNRLPIKEWVRAEWARSGLPMSRSNEACGVKNAATRKYLTQCWRWYFPPPEAIVSMAAYCHTHGAKTSRPYFSLDGTSPPTAFEWERMRSKWNHVHGVTNVWREPPVHGAERYRIKGSNGYLHANQKPLSLMERIVASCTDTADTVWEPFGGLCSATVAAMRLERRAFAAEINRDFYDAALDRLRSESPRLFRRRLAG
jgi:DNA methylase